MKREVLLVGGPGDGRIVSVESGWDAYVHVDSTEVRWSTAIEMDTSSPNYTVYRPRRRGDYAWYADQRG